MPSAPRSTHKRRSPVARNHTNDTRSVFATRPWHVVSLLWSQLPGALLSVPWSDIRGFLERFVAQLLRPNGKVRPRQIDRLRELVTGAV
jgi:hypothetical protein